MFLGLKDWHGENIISEIERAAGVSCCLSEEMRDACLFWQDIYQNMAPWLLEDKDMKSLNLGVGIAREFARLVTLELKSSVTSQDECSVFADKVYRRFLSGELRRAVERACALGGVAMKPFMSDGRIYIDVVDPLDFIPLESDDDGRITAAVFISRKDVGKKRYTKIETHRFIGNAESVTNMCYRSPSYSTGLGTMCSLSEVPEWAGLSESFTVTGIHEPLFCYFKMPYSNDIDRNSPLGVSVYSAAAELMNDADIQYTRLLWEFEGGELALDIDATTLKGAKLPAHSGRVFKKLSRGLSVGLDEFYNVFSPALRDVSLINGLNTILRRIEFSSALAYGTLSDINNTDKTAEEIRASKQRSYAAVCDIQNSLEATLRKLVYIIGVWGSLCGLCTPPRAFEMAFEWDDSIIADRAQEFTEKTQLVRDGIMQPWELRMWYFGEDEETAKRMAETVEDWNENDVL